MVTLKNTFSDGDVFSSKTTSDPDGLNGITNEINRKGVIHRKVYSSATEISTATTGTPLSDTSKTFNLSAPINSLILGINIIYETKNSSSSNSASYSALKISGTNLGTLYATSSTSYLEFKASSVNTLSPIFTSEIPSNSNYLGLTTGDGYQTISVHINKPLKILDSTTNFTIMLSGNAGTTYLKNVVIEVIYVENFEED